MSNKEHEILVEIQSLEIKDIYGLKIVYPGLCNIYSDSKELYFEFIQLLIDYKLFYFYNTGTYVGIDNKTGMHYTFDDGYYTLDWIRVLIRIINMFGAKHKDCKVRLRLSKKDVLDYGIQDINVNNQEKIIDSYIRILKTYIKSIYLEDCFDCRAKGKSYPDINMNIQEIKNAKYIVLTK